MLLINKNYAIKLIGLTLLSLKNEKFETSVSLSVVSSGCKINKDKFCVRANAFHIHVDNEAINISCDKYNIANT